MARDLEAEERHRERIEAMRGRIRLAPKAGGGTTPEELNARNRETVQAAQKAATKRPPRRTKK